MLDVPTAGALPSLPEGTDTTKPDITREDFFEQLTDDELKQLLEMSNAQPAVELEQLLAPKLPLVEDIETQLREQSVDRSMRKHISPERFAAAQEILNRYGQKEGLRCLRASDPEVARQMEQIHRSGLPSNPQKEGNQDKPE